MAILRCESCAALFEGGAYEWLCKDCAAEEARSRSDRVEGSSTWGLRPSARIRPLP